MIETIKRNVNNLATKEWPQIRAKRAYTHQNNSIAMPTWVEFNGHFTQ